MTGAAVFRFGGPRGRLATVQTVSLPCCHPPAVSAKQRIQLLPGLLQVCFQFLAAALKRR